MILRIEQRFASKMVLGFVSIYGTIISHHYRILLYEHQTKIGEKTHSQHQNLRLWVAKLRSTFWVRMGSVGMTHSSIFKLTQKNWYKTCYCGYMLSFSVGNVLAWLQRRCCQWWTLFCLKSLVSKVSNKNTPKGYQSEAKHFYLLIIL